MGIGSGFVGRLQRAQVGLRAIHDPTTRTAVVLGYDDLHYPYPLLFPLLQFERIAIADPRDIACMKLDAIGNRGSRRDFVDLHLAAQTYGLNEIFGWFAQRYASVSYSRTHLFKALTCFEDAEREPMPDMLVPLDWAAVKQYFFSQVPRLPRLR